MPNHTEMLLAVRQRHLEKLELQQAGFGPLHTPAYIVNEIEQTRAEIAQLGQQRVQQVLRAQTLSAARPAPMPGLIVLVSPRRATERLDELSAYAAIEFHRARLRHCWLIASSGEKGSFATAQELARHFGHYQVSCSVWQVIDAASIAETFALVDWLYTQQVPSGGLVESEVIADIIGGSKPMTAGMVLACGSRRPTQYLLFQQDGPSLPIALQVQTPPVYPPQAIPYP